MTGGVLVTGAGSGLGRAIALYLAAHGFTVYGGVVDTAQHEQLEAQAVLNNVPLRVIQLDITDASSIDGAVSTIVRECDGIDALINNAGISLRGYFEDLDEEEIRRTFEVNVFGAMAMTRAVLPYMRAARRGRVLFISSIGGRIGAMARTAYCASKFGLEGFAESLLQEVTPLGVQVSIVEPAIIKTERWTTNRGVARRALDPQGAYYAWFRAEEQLADALVRTSPTTPTDVAAAVYQALTVRRPRVRYVVGWRAGVILALRRYVPGELFERLYFGAATRRVTSRRPRRGCAGVVTGMRPRQPQGNSAQRNGSQHREIRLMFSLFRSTGVAAAHPAAGANSLKRASEGVNKWLWQARTALRAITVLGLQPALTAGRVRRFSQETIRGFYVTRATIALLNIGFFDEIAQRGSVNLPAFAARKALDVKVLSALTNYLYALRILSRTDDDYALDPRLKFPVTAMKGPFHVVYAYEDVMYNLEALLKGDKRYGVDVTRRSAFVAQGSGEVGQFLAFPMVADLLDRRGFRRIVDLGCGDATFLIDQCNRNPLIHAYGVDIAPEGIAAGNSNIRQCGLQDRVELFVGDIFHIDAMADQLQGIDAATSIYVLHEFLPEGKERILDMFRRFKTGFPGVPLILCEVIRHTSDELREKPGGILEIQLFHELSNQPLLSRHEWKALFQQAGFTNVEEDYLDFARTALYIVS